MAEEFPPEPEELDAIPTLHDPRQRPGLQPVPDDLGLGVTLRGFIAGQRLFDRYVLQRVLGRGGMGVVWLATDQELGEDLALKFLPEAVRLDATSLEELKRETRRSRKLAHANIVKVYDFISDGSSAAISMEFVNGDSLSGLRARRGNLCFEAREIADWIRQLLNALVYAHEGARIVHRDLKPANVMVDREGQVKVTDFGISSSISESVSRVTVQRGASGTLAYMSPQQVMGMTPSAQDDIYSLGATLYELLTGKPPFYRGDIVTQVREVVPPSMAQRRTDLDIAGEAIPEAWEETVAACLAKEPEQRPQSISEVEEMLGLEDAKKGRARRKAVVEKTPAPPPPGPVEIAPSASPTTPAGTLAPAPRKKSRAALVGISLLLLATVIGLGWYFSRGKPASEATPAQAATPAAANGPSVTEDTPLDQVQKLANAGDAWAESELGRRYRFGLGVDLDFKQALAWTQKAVDQGNADGEANLGQMYECGQGVPLDYTQALSWYQKAAAQGNAKAETNLGDMYEAGTSYQQGQGVARDYQQARAWFQKAADQGYAPAQTALGDVYQFGYGVTEDYHQALTWMKKAADQGDAQAEWSLGSDYQYGGMVKADPNQSRLWYQKAINSYRKKAEQGDDYAQSMLGLIYTQGDGTSVDKEQADGWYRKDMAFCQKAADQGDAFAAYGLASLYQAGEGTAADGQEAASWYKKSADAGDLFAWNSLAYLYETGAPGLPKDDGQAQSWYQKLFAAYQKSADQGDIGGMTQLAGMYERGEGVAKDEDQALAWYKKAADLGGASEQYQLALAYGQLGSGCQQDDPARAKDYFQQEMIWYKKAADNGSIDALKGIGDIYSFGEGVPQDKDEAISWYRKAADRGDFNAQNTIDILSASH